MATKNAINSNIPIELSLGGTNATSMTDTDGVIYYDGTRLVTTAVGTATHVLTSNGPAVAPTFQAAGGGGGVKVTTYTSNDTWTKDADCKAVSLLICSGGCGGGSGRRGASGAAGGGGGAGSPTITTVPITPANYFGATEDVVIGAGGAGGAAQTSNDTNGSDATAGGISRFGGYETTADATGGKAGVNGASAASTAGYIVTIPIPQLVGGTVGTKGQLTAGLNGAEKFPTNLTTFISGSAGSGGGANTGTVYAGGDGAPRTRTDTTVIIAAAVGGTESGTINGANGSDGNVGSGIFTIGLPGAGGGGQSGGAAAGIGGNGGFPSGPGGGGGGSINGTNSGAGGDGGDGVVYVIEYLG